MHFLPVTQGGSRKNVCGFGEAQEKNYVTPQSPLSFPLNKERSLNGSGKLSVNLLGINS